MNMADAAEEVLRRNGRDLSSREIASQAIADGLIAPRSDKPWVYIAAAIERTTDAGRNKDKTHALPPSQRTLQTQHVTQHNGGPGSCSCNFGNEEGSSRISTN